MIRPPSLSYRLLSFALFLFWLLHACWQAIKHRQINYLWQRLGIFPATNQRALWVHASSVGEVELVKPLIQALSVDHPVVLTTFTASGYQHAQTIMPPHILIRVLPIDFYPVSRIFMSRHRFRLGLVAETELWPETLYQAKRQGTCLLRVNARLSAKSQHGNAIISDILLRTLRYFDNHLTRNDTDVETLLSMGIAGDQISVCGNLKQAGAEADEPYDNLVGRPYILFASTHAPEERLFAELLRSRDMTELAVIAPRHPQRAAEILRVLQSNQFNVRQRSRQQAIEGDTEIYLADTLGELKALMAHAEMVIMGGSFNDTGGHNVLEPARLGKVIITGPSDENIRSDIELLSTYEGIVQVADVDELAAHLDSLLGNPQLRRTLGDNARNAVMQQDNVLQGYLATIHTYLEDAR